MTYRLFIITLLCSLTSFALSANFPVHQITISGNQRTKDFVILREMVVSVDSIYSSNGEKSFEELIQISKDRILNLNLFNTVEINHKIIYMDGAQGYAVTVAVVEKWFTWPIPFVEFSDRNFNVWGNLDFDPDRTNYGLYVFNYNLFGRNHTLKTKMKTGYNTKLGLEYRIPFISRNTDWGINTLVEYSAQNEVWYQTRNDSLQFFKNGNNNLIANTQAYIELLKRTTPYTRVYYGLSFSHAELADAVPTGDYFLNSSGYQRNYAAYMKLENDKRNNIFFPTQGSYGAARVEAQLWQNSTNQANGHVSGRIQKFSKWTDKIYTAVSLYGEYNTQTNAPYAYRKLLGYDEIVRGYEHYVIDGTLGTRANAALRYRLLDRDFNLPIIPVENYQKIPSELWLELYSDAGYATHGSINGSNTLPDKLIYSVGVGLNALIFNDRLLRLEYSLNGRQEGGFFVHFNKAI